MSQPDGSLLDRLFATIAARRGADPATSYTAKLFHSGTERIAKKLGEEAVETVIEAVRRNPQGVIAESADLLYHLLVVWADAGVPPSAVWGKLMERDGVSGLAEKASRRSNAVPSP